MDPLTAVLQLATVIAEIVKIAMEGQPPDVRAELWRQHLEDIKAWRAFWQGFHPKP
jgi:hypothetical protein